MFDCVLVPDFVSTKSWTPNPGFYWRYEMNKSPALTVFNKRIKMKRNDFCDAPKPEFNEQSDERPASDELILSSRLKLPNIFKSHMSNSRGVGQIWSITAFYVSQESCKTCFLKYVA